MNKVIRYVGWIYLALVIFCVSVYGFVYSRSLLAETTFPYILHGQMGDTEAYTGWTPSSDGGPWNGGFLIGTIGDASWDGIGAVTSPHIISLVMNSYVPGNVGATSITSVGGTGVNTMSSWGNAGDGGCMGTADGSTASMGFTPFSLRGKLYLPVMCLSASGNFTGTQEAMLISYDRWLHTCNWANYKSGGATPNSCDVTNASGVGDVITGVNMTYKTISQTTTQWRAADFTGGNKMSRLYVIVWGQDALPNGPIVPSGVNGAIDTTYTYAVSQARLGSGLSSPIYCHRFLTSSDPMDPTNWQHWNGTTWISDFTLSTPLDLGGYGDTSGFGIMDFYSPVAKKFFMMLSCDENSGADMLQSDFPWGPYSLMPSAPYSPTPPVNLGYTGFLSFLLPTYVESGNNFTISYNIEYFASGAIAADPSFQKWQFSTVGAGSVHSGHKVTSGKVIIH